MARQIRRALRTWSSATWTRSTPTSSTASPREGRRSSGIPPTRRPRTLELAMSTSRGRRRRRGRDPGRPARGTSRPRAGEPAAARRPRVGWHRPASGARRDDRPRAPGGSQQELGGAAGDLVTLLPVGDATGVRTDGLRYPLVGETLRAGRSRGLSNEVEHAPASVSLEGGSLLIIETRKEPGI